ncbi:Ran GTPase-activating protein 1 [Hondaea fermentalgiana]|uniref:Ran GTPase-activating protein 1 n=1 Tax=Hondaea fermentalgiana TaxID=2315210 RepID=A0A2R5GA47_9STRA|nr:Ran GTPase-activating protein 1 [Hondaea fermentalgiana]|eukprot:GBG24971.1 Ran GTPase-activating protein 1 [Hondaea fermentalgiana]
MSPRVAVPGPLHVGATPRGDMRSATTDVKLASELAAELAAELALRRLPARGRYAEDSSEEELSSEEYDGDLEDNFEVYVGFKPDTVNDNVADDVVQDLTMLDEENEVNDEMEEESYEDEDLYSEMQESAASMSHWKVLRAEQIDDKYLDDSSCASESGSESQNECRSKTSKQGDSASQDINGTFIKSEPNARSMYISFRPAKIAEDETIIQVKAEATISGLLCPVQEDTAKMSTDPVAPSKTDGEEGLSRQNQETADGLELIASRVVPSFVMRTGAANHVESLVAIAAVWNLQAGSVTPTKKELLNQAKNGTFLYVHDEAQAAMRIPRRKKSTRKAENEGAASSGDSGGESGGDEFDSDDNDEESDEEEAEAVEEKPSDATRKEDDKEPEKVNIKESEALEDDSLKTSSGESAAAKTKTKDGSPGNGEEDSGEMKGTSSSTKENAKNKAELKRGFSFDRLRSKSKKRGKRASGGNGGDSSDEEAAKDPRERVTVSVETVREAIIELRTQDDEEVITVTLEIACYKRRCEARRKLRKAQEDHDAALAEFRRVQCDQYESQLVSVMTKAEHNLERWEHVLRQQHMVKAFFDFGDEGAHTLAKALKYKRTLERVSLPKNEIGSMGLKSLTSILSRCPALHELDLRGNPLGVESGEHISLILVKCPLLRRLNLHDCGLGAKGVATFIKAARQRGLHSLDLRHNGLGREGCLTVAREFLQDNEDIIELDLATNEIGAGEAAEALAEAIPTASALRCIDLSHNGMAMVLRRPKYRDLFVKFRVDVVVGLWKSTRAPLLDIVAPALTD